jgi:hypothetical protein
MFNDFREDHPQFIAALSTAQTRFHLTPSETAAFSRRNRCVINLQISRLSLSTQK